MHLLLQIGLRLLVPDKVDTALVGTGGSIEGDSDYRSAGVGYADLKGEREMPATAGQDIAIAEQEQRGKLARKDDRGGPLDWIVDAVDKGLGAEHKALAGADGSRRG